MRTIWMACLALLTVVNGRGEECAVRVTVSSGNSVSTTVLSQAKQVAGQIFHGIGAELKFDGRSGGCEMPIRMVIGNAGVDERAEALGSAMVGTAAQRVVHVFVDRVNLLAGRTASSVLLGHVMAHEIAHVLEGVPRHSHAGVMKARWERRDLIALQYRPLPFEEGDRVLIHAALEHAALEKAAESVPKTGD